MDCIWSVESAPKCGIIIKGLIGVKRYYGMSKETAIADYKYQYERKSNGLQENTRDKQDAKDNAN